jgi:hypothetical protein
MISEKLALTDQETLDEVLDCLTENFTIQTQRAFNQKNLFEIQVTSGKYWG